MIDPHAGSYHAAYAIVAAVYLGYAASIAARARSLARRLASARSRAKTPQG